MEKDMLVSVVIPTYHRPVFLKRCIDSVLDQTYKNIEIIVVDDNDPKTEARKETELVMQALITLRTSGMIAIRTDLQHEIPAGEILTESISPLSTTMM